MQPDRPIIKARSEEGEDLYGQEPLRGQRRNAARQAQSARRRGPEKQRETRVMAKGHAEDKGGMQQRRVIIWPKATPRTKEERSRTGQ